jgi:hydrogenase expression/formation protein HypE
VTTTGIGQRLPGASVPAAGVRPGDALLLSGPIGLHGTTVLSVREGLGFDADIASDTQPLHRLVRTMVEKAGSALHAMRDPTRGLASALNEIAQASSVGIVLWGSRFGPRSVPIALEDHGDDGWGCAGCQAASTSRSHM